MKNSGLENDGPTKIIGVENARLENDGLNTDNDNIRASWKAIPFESTKDSSQSYEHF